MHSTQGIPAAPADPRHVLVNTIERLNADGYPPVMAVELEFYLLDRQRDVNGRPLPALQTNGVRPVAPQVYGVYELEQVQPLLDDLYVACALQGLPVRAISEYAPGQLELAPKHRLDALQAIRGMMATSFDSLAIFCPHANSYRRFQTDSYASLAKS